MITEIKKLGLKYRNMSYNSEYVAITQVINDLYQLEQDARLKRVPKELR